LLPNVWWLSLIPHTLTVVLTRIKHPTRHRQKRDGGPPPAMRFPTHNRPRTAAPLKGEPPLGEVQFFLSVQHHRLILVRL